MDSGVKTVFEKFSGIHEQYYQSDNTSFSLDSVPDFIGRNILENNRLEKESIRLDIQEVYVSVDLDSDGWLATFEFKIGQPEERYTPIDPSRMKSIFQDMGYTVWNSSLGEPWFTIEIKSW